jgi:N utilization substance protein B
MPARRKGRELAVQMLYQWDVGRQPIETVLESFWELTEGSDATQVYTRRLVKGTVEHLEAIDALISSHAENWRLERIAVVDRNIMRLAIYEFLHEDTPKKVVINEALEVAKKFSTSNAVQFINGILDAVKLTLEKTKEAG